MSNLLFNIQKQGDRFNAKPIGSSSSQVASVANYSSSSNGVPGNGGQTTPVNTQNVTKSNPQSVIDVVSQFKWSASKINEDIVKIPHILVKEYYLKKSTLAHQLAYYAAAGAGAGLDNTKVILNAFGLEGKGVTDYLKDKAKGISDKLTNLAGIKASTTDSETIQMYSNMYPICPTGFDYRFPYYSDSYASRNHTWSSAFQGFGENEITKLAEDLIAAAQKYTTDKSIIGAGITEPGVFVERSKYYQPSEGESISVTFPLLNTFDVSDVQKNFDLIWLLTFQNTPYRKNKSLLDPPCMYEVLIPGVRYIKFAVVDRLAVQFLGTRREIELQIPSDSDGGRDTKKTIVPEAYNITLSFKSLNTDSSNFMIEAINKS